MATDSPQTEADLAVSTSAAGMARAGRRRTAPAARDGAGEVWLNGEVLSCACPDCGSPMSVRLWLCLADCWRCGTSIELSEEAIEQAQRLLQESQEPKRAQATATVPTPPPPPASPSRAPSEPPVDARAPEAKRRVTVASPPATLKRQRRAAASSGVLWWRQVSKELPAWLASLILHLAVLLLLAVWLLPAKPEEPPYITISTQLDIPVREGELLLKKNPEFADFELPVDPQGRSDALTMKQKNQDAKKLRIGRDAPLPAAPPIHAVVSNIRSDDPGRRMIATRDPRVRVEMVTKEGGTTSTEAAVSRGLDWLNRQQRANGSWSLKAHGGSMESDAGATSLALLPFLGAGQTHLVGTYQPTVDRGLGFLLSIQKENGDLRGNSQSNAGMYAHGQAAIVLCEAYKLTGDQKLKQPAQRAIDFIVEAQHAGGGWRYRPGEVGDLSVTGWQIMALYCAQSAGLEVPEATSKLAGYFLDSVEKGSHGGLYCYMPKREATPSMTAEGLLCRMYLGWKASNPGLEEGVEYLRRHLPGEGESSIYYLYYATQTMHHVGGDAWKEWNLKMRDNLVSSQATKGDNAGSWAPRSNHDRSGGRLYATALATATLEVYYRHAPLFRQIDLR